MWLIFLLHVDCDMHGLLFYFTAFCPFHIGQFTVILLSLEEVVSKSLKNAFVMILEASCTDNILNWFEDLTSMGTSPKVVILSLFKKLPT